MFIIRGRRTLRIKKFTYHQHSCTSCYTYNLSIKVYREYFHICFVPIHPVGYNIIKMQCKHCGEPVRSMAIEKQYEQVRAPFYLYSGFILFIGMIVGAFITSTTIEQEKEQFIASPKVGDVYIVKKKDSSTTNYYFLRVHHIVDDTVLTYHNSFVYNQYVSKLVDGDYFMKEEEMAFPKAELKTMLNDGEIAEVQRNYDDSKGFNRIK
jgi:hypothetical protein